MRAGKRVSIPRVSVVTVVKDAEAFISEAVDSILQQTFKDFEFIIVDDCSTDGTSLALANFKDPRLDVISLTKSPGYPQVRNVALERTVGEFIAVLDADDIAHPQRLATQVEFLDSNPEYGAVGSWARVFGAHETVRRYPVSDQALRASLMFGNPFLHSSMTIRKNALPPDSAPYLPAHVHAEDYSLWLRISERWKLANIPQQLVKYRVHGSQISEQNKERAKQSLDRARNEFLHAMGLKHMPGARLSFRDVSYLGKLLGSRGWVRASTLYLYWLKAFGTEFKNLILEFSERNPLARIAVALGRRAKSARNSPPK